VSTPTKKEPIRGIGSFLKAPARASAITHKSLFIKQTKRIRLVLLVADVLFLGGIEGQVADGSNENVNTAGDVTQNDVCTGSGGVSLGLEAGVIDDKAAEPTQEEGQQKANESVVIFHFVSPFNIKM
jgi:hypothetical protein